MLRSSSVYQLGSPSWNKPTSWIPVLSFFSRPANPPCLSIEFSDAIIKLEESVSYIIFFYQTIRDEVNLFTMIGGGININSLKLVSAGVLTPGDVVFNINLPFVPSSFISTWIGEFSFWARQGLMNDLNYERRKFGQPTPPTRSSH